VTYRNLDKLLAIEDVYWLLNEEHRAANPQTQKPATPDPGGML
jgi:hypothetical protein